MASFSSPPHRPQSAGLKTCGAQSPSPEPACPPATGPPGAQERARCAGVGCSAPEERGVGVGCGAGPGAGGGASGSQPSRDESAELGAWSGAVNRSGGGPGRYGGCLGTSGGGGGGTSSGSGTSTGTGRTRRLQVQALGGGARCVRAGGGCGCGAAAAEVTLAGQEGTGTRCDPRQAQAQSRGFPGVRRDGGTLGPSQHGRWGGSLWGEVAAVSKANTTHARAAGLPAPTPAARPAPAGP